MKEHWVQVGNRLIALHQATHFTWYGDGPKPPGTFDWCCAVLSFNPGNSISLTAEEAIPLRDYLESRIERQ